MTIFEALLLGLTQGLTEFLPVSSSAHLTLLQNLLGLTGDTAHFFLEWINLGTLLAMLIYFWPDLKQLCLDIFKHHHYTLFINIIITCLPAGLAGLFLSDLIETSPFFSSLITLGVMLGLVGFVMIKLYKVAPEKSTKVPKKSAKLQSLKNKFLHRPTSDPELNLTKQQALLIGLAQVFALIPGVSRMGSTMIAGRLVGLNNHASARYSFLVAIPLMLAVILKNFVSTSARTYLFANLPALLIANALAFLAGFFILRKVMAYFAQGSTKAQKNAKSQFIKTAKAQEPHDTLRPFGFYRIALALFVLILALTTVL